MSAGHHDSKALNPADFVLPDPTYGKFRNLSVVALVIGGVLTALGASGEKSNFYYGYLIGYMFWLSIALGALFFILVGYLTRAGWNVVVRRTAEAFASTLPFFAVLFVPIAIGLHDMYSWTHEGHVTASKAKYLNPTFFLIRAALYFVIWSVIALYFSRQSTKQDESGDASLTAKMQSASPLATIFFALSVSFAGFDWVMSLQPHWYSTIFGVYIFAGCILSGFALLAIAIVGLSKLKGVQGVIHVEHFHSIGKFVFGFTVFWAYIAFSQFMLIWYANIPEETEFFQHRFHHGWETVSAALLLGQFVLAFLILLPRATKRVPALLTFGSLWVLFFHYVDLFWLIAPHKKETPGSEEFAHFHVTVGDLGSFLLVGGIFGVLAVRALKQHAVVPLKDPRLDESLATVN